MAPWLLWSAIQSSARLSTVAQILLFLPLTLATLSTNAFLLLSLLLFFHSLIHSTLALVWGSPTLTVLQVPMHSILLLTCFNLFSQSVHPLLTSAATWWGTFLKWSSPGFIIMEAMSSLVVVQKLGQVGKDLVMEGEGYQFSLLVAAASAYVLSAFWIVVSYPSAATSPLSSTLLGVAMTALLFLTLIGFALRRTNVIESSGIFLFIAYNVWLCGFDVKYFSDTSSPYTPLVGNIWPHMQALINFISNTLPKPVLVALVYRLAILQCASRILPSIGADNWERESGVDDSSDDRPTTKVTRLLLMYRQSILITVYSHLLLLDPASQVWWRWVGIFFTLTIWTIELLVGSDDGLEKWKVE